MRFLLEPVREDTMTRKLAILSSLLLLGGVALAQNSDATRSNGAPSGRSQPSPSSDQPSAVGSAKDGGVASNNAYGQSTGKTGTTYHGKRAGSIPRPHNAPMPGNAEGNTGKN